MLWQEERDRVLDGLTWYSDHWTSHMYLVQSKMHPSMWLMIKGKEPLTEVKMDQSVPDNKFANQKKTHMDEGTYQGNTCIVCRRHDSSRCQGL
eukprot:10920039-Prorocentrum_lima.AAC.1